MPKVMRRSRHSQQTRKAQSPINQTLLAVATKFAEIHLDTPAKRDLLVWFTEHPHQQFAPPELITELSYPSTTITTGLRALQEAGVIVPAGSRPGWQLTSDPATCTISRLAAQLVEAQTVQRGSSHRFTAK